MKVFKYRKKLPRRTLRLVITEHEDRVEILFTPSKIGDFGDDELIEKFFYPILSPYDKDKRPIVWTDPFTGDTTAVYGDANSCVAFRNSPGRNRN